MRHVCITGKAEGIAGPGAGSFFIAKQNGVYYDDSMMKINLMKKHFCVWIILIGCLALGGCGSDTYEDSSGLYSDETSGWEETESGGWEEMEFDPQHYPYYGMLEEDQKEVYCQLYYCASAGEKSFIPCRDIWIGELKEIFAAVYRDHPELFWLEAEYEYAHRTGKLTEVVLYYNDLADDLEGNRGRIEAAVQEFLDAAASCATPQEQERLIHDMLLRQVVYEEGAPYNQNIYSTLAEGKTVCSGYAKAFQYLMQRLGIPCYYCVGRSVNPCEETEEEELSSAEEHAWNIICLNGEYYNVDVTWDDTVLEEEGLIYYGYYNQTDEEFQRDHVRLGTSGMLPECNDGSYTYEALYGTEAELGILKELELEENDVVDSLEAYYDRCRELLIQNGTGECTITLIVHGEDVEEAIRDSVDRGDYLDGYLTGVVREMNMNGYHFSVQVTTRRLSGGYYLLRQTTFLEE